MGTPIVNLSEKSRCYLIEKATLGPCSLLGLGEIRGLLRAIRNSRVIRDG